VFFHKEQCPGLGLLGLGFLFLFWLIEKGKKREEQSKKHSGKDREVRYQI